MMNAGKVCIAPDYILTPPDRHGELVEALRTAVSRMYPTLLSNDDYTSVVNERHHVRLNACLEDAQPKGAELVEINPGSEDFSTADVHKIPLTLVFDPTDEMVVMREEIFGAVLPIRRYTDIAEAIDS